MIARLISSLRFHCDAAESGAAAVEFAITAPLLVALMIGVGDYGALMNNAASLVSASRAGAEVVKAISATTGTQLDALNLAPSGATFTVAANPSCTCVDGTTPSPLPTCPGPNASNPCSGVVVGGVIDTRVLKYRLVSVSQSVAPLLSVTNLLYFGTYNSSQTLTSTASIRIQ
jgi:Flp pilus assembly protein TadG